MVRGENILQMNKIERYFESIRNNEIAINAFMEAMPKGADIHHHALGALWPEDVLALAAAMGLWVDVKTGQLHPKPAMAWYKASELQTNEDLRKQVFAQWSVLGYDKSSGLAHEHFFGIFPKIEPVFVGKEAYWLEKIATHAAEEGLLYIETLIELPEVRNTLCGWAKHYSDWPKNPIIADEIDFERFYDYLETKQITTQVALLCEKVATWQSELAKSNKPTAQLSYQFYAIRTMEPLEVFAQLIAYFKAAQQSPHIVGVNLVAPEYHPNALNHYRLHIRICQWLKKRFPEVNLALHAGELTDKIVEGEHLRFHIEEAVRIAGAKRIGHGVDLLSETHPNARKALLDFMKAQGIALEVLPDSNDFILGVKGAEHPFMTYMEHGVPLVLATDDPGLLCCTLSQQFKIIATLYRELSYGQLKEMAFNSLRYSFLAEEDKGKLLAQLESQFLDFEQNIISA